MKTNKQYRLNDNPQEQIFHDKFKDMFEHDNMSKKTLSAIIFGWSDGTQNIPIQNLTEDEESICLNLIQWLGSPVGQGFLESCGFTSKNK